MADALYTRGIQQYLLGNIDSENDTIKLAFMSPAYTPDYDSEEYYSDISANVASGTTDLTLANVSIDIATGIVNFDCDDDSDTGITATTDKVVIYKDTTVAATSPLIGCFEFAEGTLSPVGGTLAFTVPTGGFFGINND